MNPSQKRGLLMMCLSIVGALVVFVFVLSYVSEVRAQVGPIRQVVALRNPVAARQVVSADDLELVAMPDRWLPSAAIPADELANIAGQIARLDQPAGALVHQGMFGPHPRLGPDQVEISASLSVDSALGGRVRPGDVVHVSAAYLDAAGTEHVHRIIEGALVLHIGDAALAGDTFDSGFGESGLDGDDDVLITFALDASAANCLTYAENFAENVLLARPGEFASFESGRSDCPTGWVSNTEQIGQNQ